MGLRIVLSALNHYITAICRNGYLDIGTRASPICFTRPTPLAEWDIGKSSEHLYSIYGYALGWGFRKVIFDVF